MKLPNIKILDERMEDYEKKYEMVCVDVSNGDDAFRMWSEGDKSH